ncbi:hypothetical protein AXFE_08370 [Acidithrix ferrooxidans]|uniref:Uncharacterized protein n=1 Tax=Acidithrix ferrooxidans TaxID=1280514 RepID=A0A0D8HKK1_9ACTN|nr:hypothetical protein AXFE_08370 [Acidithrix ferrooxidans]
MSGSLCLEDDNEPRLPLVWSWLVSSGFYSAAGLALKSALVDPKVCCLSYGPTSGVVALRALALARRLTAFRYARADASTTSVDMPLPDTLIPSDSS